MAAEGTGRLRGIKATTGNRERKRLFSRSTAVPTHRQFARSSGPLPTESHDQDIYNLESFLSEQNARQTALPTDPVPPPPSRRQRRVIEVRISKMNDDMSVASLHDPSQMPSSNAPKSAPSGPGSSESVFRSAAMSRKRKAFPHSSAGPVDRVRGPKAADDSGSGTADEVQVQRGASNDEIDTQSEGHDEAEDPSNDLEHQNPVVTSNRLKGLTQPRMAKQHEPLTSKPASTYLRESQQTSRKYKLGLHSRDDAEELNHSEVQDTHGLDPNADEGAEFLRGHEANKDGNREISSRASRSTPSQQGQTVRTHKSRPKLNKRAHTGRFQEPSENPEESGEPEELEASDEAEPSSDNRRELFGQKKNLATAWDMMKTLELDHQERIHVKPIKELRKLCAKAVKAFQDLRNGNGDVTGEHEKPVEIRRIAEIVSELCKPSKDDATDMDIIFAMYRVGIPSLTKLYNQSIRCFREMDEDQSSGEPFTIDHLRIVTELIELALKVGKSLITRYSNKARVVDETRLIHSRYTMVLQEVHKTFQSHIKAHESAELGEIARQEADAALERDREQRERDKKQDEELRRQEEAKQHEVFARLKERKQEEATRKQKSWDIQKKINQLHLRREAVENYALLPRGERIAKRDHLANVDPRNVIEADSNGVLFMRDQALTMRVGPPFPMIQRAGIDIWSREEKNVLKAGLKEWAGPMVIESIIDAHCGPGQVLNEYNVTQILTMVARLKVELLEEQVRKGLPIEGWMHEIPESIKRYASGTENIEGVV